MAIKVKAVERELKIGNLAGQYRYILQADLYNELQHNNHRKNPLFTAYPWQKTLEVCYCFCRFVRDNCING